MGVLLTVLEQGLIFGILALGVYLTYKVLDFADLSVEEKNAEIISALFNAEEQKHIFTNYTSGHWKKGVL